MWGSSCPPQCFQPKQVSAPGSKMVYLAAAAAVQSPCSFNKAAEGMSLAQSHAPGDTPRAPSSSSSCSSYAGGTKNRARRPKNILNAGLEWGLRKIFNEKDEDEDENDDACLVWLHEEELSSEELEEVDLAALFTQRRRNVGSARRNAAAAAVAAAGSIARQDCRQLRDAPHRTPSGKYSVRGEADVI
eukprot:CAMPEP_0206566650 /NCGR_PEP_ID=MMETSP0325_2-20121206/24786_1 /ASSEMBLY_ACC=CAM_ASM_000347 /TAXON_ID=2866 /ORGANISM="Crypthecodinium cohnii, Strain Seligo" /LENGTH=187 /DNA_ID=CAMNT_0054069723 /DNA_START=32 /DNA_END=592 /DNA_ORIENTATION=-